MSLENTLRDLAPGLLRYCGGRIGCPFLAEEIAQESLRILVERWQKSGPPENAAAFLFAVARRRAARLAARRRLLSPLDPLLERPSQEPAPDAVILLKERFGKAQQALGRLSRQDREVLLLFAAAELDLASIAEVLGLSLSAVKMRLHRARRRLLEQMEVIHELA
ncbi:MAG: sigma-70 family RNA polymerase sigma factor [Deltaproteobacteria bacterium]|nr:sigma-70 family RNA polymerase sigma factor [Deltaproteobacteria bacterium]